MGIAMERAQWIEKKKRILIQGNLPLKYNGKMKQTGRDNQGNQVGGIPSGQSGNNTSGVQIHGTGSLLDESGFQYHIVTIAK